MTRPFLFLLLLSTEVAALPPAIPAESCCMGHERVVVVDGVVITRECLPVSSTYPPGVRPMGGIKRCPDMTIRALLDPCPGDAQ